MLCPYCNAEIGEEEICPSCAGNVKNFNKVLEVKQEEKDIYTRRIIVKFALIIYIIFVCICAVLMVTL